MLLNLFRCIRRSFEGCAGANPDNCGVLLLMKMLGATFYVTYLTKAILRHQVAFMLDGTEKKKILHNYDDHALSPIV